MNSSTKKRMIIMLIGVGILFGAVFGWKIFTGLMMKKYISSNQAPIVAVSATKVSYQEWQPKLVASGSLRAIRGVNVTAQLAGMINTIYFTPGADVLEGSLLVQQNATDDVAQLHALEASAELAKINYERDKKQYQVQAISKATLDTDAANLKNLTAQVAQQAAIVQKKTIRAPFAGRLGISQVNPGQYINPGQAITMLQTLDPIYVDFYVPQQSLAQLKLDMPAAVTLDAFPGEKFTGKVTTINPGVDVDTRNVEVEATIDNPKHLLAPGMFSTVEVTLGEPQKYLTLPQTAVIFNPYGQVIYTIKETGKDAKGPILTVSQSFVTTGETRGDQIVVLSGLKEGDQVVTGGQLKLRNGSRVAINNTIQPADNPAPNLSNEHD